MPRSRPSRYVNRGPSRVLAVGFLALTLGVGCQAALTPAPTSSATVEASPTATPSATTTATTTSSASSSIAASASPASGWRAAGTMTIGRYGPHAVLLGDGRVLVVGNDTAPFVRSDSITTEIWDPISDSWHATASLNQPRGDLATAALTDGRALVTGGLDQDQSCSTFSSTQRSYSSTYVFDPKADGGAWVRAGLLGTARTAPAAAVLPDGRVLVAGGYYYTGQSAERVDAPLGIAAAYHRVALGEPATVNKTLNDITPPTVGHALATAEVFDPSTGTWSATGPMHFARFGAAATTLVDGRVLVVGSAAGAERGVASVDDRAYDSAELYDPATGRFKLVGSLPGLDAAAFSKQGKLPGYSPVVDFNGNLVSLLDGGALLVGRSSSWKHQGDVTRTFRFDATSGSWREVGGAWVSVENPDTGAPWVTPTARRGDASLVARLQSGRVLVAGGIGEYGAVTRTVDLFDPVTNGWSPLPPMPSPRAGGAAVTLRDGSVLLLGGFNDVAGRGGCDEPSGLTSAIRFVPAP
ncbi:MAG TPA: kelch repeat-containing protein [Candidatus Dormibacteraeota bacterium]|nr:kelch repeat-containing protein [Candidatus Dormibacteraeota bacterium]